MKYFVDRRDIFLYLLCLITFLGFMYRLLSTFNHNEQMYISAAFLMSRGYEIYTDFAFLQMPLLPLIMSPLMKVGDVIGYLVSAKLLLLLVMVRLR